ncbi:MAG: radical SAM protein [Nitrospirae bacterium]|nr:radical SAM protein [Nitrospirota bacterium]
MIDLTVLYCGRETPSTPHRYGKALKNLKVPEHQAHAVAKSAMERRPVTVWNTTRTCNLRCVHCYSNSEEKKYEGELTTEEAKALINDLGDFRIPALLFSGGEPLVRKDIFELAAYAREKKGVHVVFSTNGTLITEEVARRMRAIRVSYVGISLDGMEDVNDRFRGVEGAFARAMRGFRNCVAVGQKVGLRLTLTRQTFNDLHRIFDFIEAEKVNRACFYHLVPSGRGHGVVDLSPAESRQAMDVILDRTMDFHRRNVSAEILTVDNHCDGPYMYLKMKAAGDPRAEEVYEMLKWNGGGLYSSGVGFGCIDFLGNVHPDQFWMHYTFGNVRERKFSEIWMDTADPLMAGLKDRRKRIKGRCAGCRFLDLCGGALRVRAEISTGDPWASDPACYLTDEEIGAQPGTGEGTLGPRTETAGVV